MNLDKGYLWGKKEGSGLGMGTNGSSSVSVTIFYLLH